MKKATLGAIAALLAATLACSIFVGGPAYPTGPIPDATQAAQTLQDELQKAMSDAATTGVVTLHLTEDELTTLVASKLSQQSKPLLTDPRVVLRDGQMIVYGTATSGVFVAHVSIAMQASVDADGKPVITITQTDFGPLPAPAALNDVVSGLVQEAFTGALGPVATGFRLTDISIADGVMTVTGRVK